MTDGEKDESLHIGKRKQDGNDEWVWGVSIALGHWVVIM